MLIEQLEMENGCVLSLCFQLQNSPLLVLRAKKGFYQESFF